MGLRTAKFLVIISALLLFPSLSYSAAIEGKEEGTRVGYCKSINFVGSSTLSTSGMDCTLDSSGAGGALNVGLLHFAESSTASPQPGDMWFTQQPEYNYNLWFMASGTSSSFILKQDIDYSAELAAILQDETGSGYVVFSDSPILVAPILGNASATDIDTETIEANTGTITQLNYSELISGSTTLVMSAGTGIKFDSNADDVHEVIIGLNRVKIADGNSLDLSEVNQSDTAEGLYAPGATTVDYLNATHDGQIVWNKTDDYLGIGGGSSTFNFYPVTNTKNAGYCTFNDTLNKIDCVAAGGSSAGDKFVAVLSPQQAKLNAPAAAIDAANNQWQGLFDASLQECMTWEGDLYPYASSNISMQAQMSWASTNLATVRTVLWAEIGCVTPNAAVTNGAAAGGDSEDVDSITYGTSAILYIHPPATIGSLAYSSTTTLNDTCAQGDYFTFRFCRNGPNAIDTAGGDMELRKILLYE